MWKKTGKIEISPSSTSILELEGELVKQELELKRQDIGDFKKPTRVSGRKTTGNTRTSLVLKNKGVEERSRRDETEMMMTPEKNWSLAQRCLERKSIMYEQLKRDYGKLHVLLY